MVTVGYIVWVILLMVWNFYLALKHEKWYNWLSVIACAGFVCFYLVKEYIIN